MKKASSNKSSLKSFPIFGRIDTLPLKIKPKVEIGDKLTFTLNKDDLKQMFKFHGLNPDNYTIFDEDGVNSNYEMIPLLTHLCQSHEVRLNEYEIRIKELEKEILC